ncbi:MAG TPA: hypothetical protein VMN77_04920 [Nitrospiria bacterium]|jgi:hypothetical protein|nr:hypothetical protein [Nitrospiria bacterium]
MPKPMRTLSALVVILLILAFSQDLRAKQPPKPEFTIETLPADNGPVESRIWSLGDSIRILEAMSLPNTCDTVVGEVKFQDDNTEVFVKLKPESQNPPGGTDCHPNDVPVMVSVTIPNMPFVVGCHHNITLETPQGIKTRGVRIVW